MDSVIFRVIFAFFLSIYVLSVRTIAWTLPKNNGKLSKSAHPDGVVSSPLDRAAGVKDSSALWPGGVVVYDINGTFSSGQLSLLKSAMDDIASKSCITFEKWDGERDYVSITNKPLGCTSYVGRAMGRQFMNLETPHCTEDMGTVLHELLHTLGVILEHSRPDRDRYIEIINQNMEEGRKAIVHMKYDWDTVQNLTVPYDLESVMHFNKYASSKNGYITILPKMEGADIPAYANSMSPNDIRFINLLYKC